MFAAHINWYRANRANCLSVFRMVCAAIIVLAIISVANDGLNQFGFALVVSFWLAVGWATDLVDGRYARDPYIHNRLSWDIDGYADTVLAVASSFCLIWLPVGDGNRMLVAVCLALFWAATFVAIRLSDSGSSAVIRLWAHRFNMVFSHGLVCLVVIPVACTWAVTPYLAVVWLLGIGVVTCSGYDKLDTWWSGPVKATQGGEVGVEHQVG